MLFEQNLDSQVIDLKLKANAPATKEQIVNIEINEFICSKKYQEMIAADCYYSNENDILKQRRKTIGENGQLTEAENVADNRLTHDFFSTIVDQKVQYLLGKQWSIDSKDKNYDDKITELFNEEFQTMMRRVAKDAIKKGIGWIFVVPNEKQHLKFKRIDPVNVIPLWTDNDHTELQAVIYFYETVYYEGTAKGIKRYAQYWEKSGVTSFESNGFSYIQQDSGVPMLVSGGEEKAYNWERIPFIPLRYNDEEISLLRKIKRLIDDYDKQTSRNSNLLEDETNKITVLKNYDGQGLDEFRENLKKYRAVKVSGDGGVDALDGTADVTNADAHLDRTKKDIYTFGRAVDTNVDFGANASAEARQYQYALLDMDCNTLEQGCHSFLHNLIWFINAYYVLPDTEVEFVFNRDILVNEMNAIEMCVKAQSIHGVSRKTIVSNFPWVRDVDMELKEYDKETAEYKNDNSNDPFSQNKEGENSDE
ncbi:phage portal protein [Anaerosinus massiliensis]|uniref:phage portal protein n=1 Tax=Massilibacillus massiliensis TaxID=1806837 RepID=UPI000DA63D85|nr:phage portal protein [Massilibacillus massiliensis]